ncbi:MAG: hypothetical protein LUC49_04610 [Prevotella sp.]|nr:hypothetical protein [Prevotella sp.]
MSLYKFALCAVVVAFLSSCKKEIKTEDVVKGVAEQYCAYLLGGDYGAYVDATYRTETLGEDERTELIDNLKMFAAQQQKERQGITKAEVSKVEVSADDDTADVFLLITYGDSTQEQVLQPMVKRGGLWYLR